MWKNISVILILLLIGGLFYSKTDSQKLGYSPPVTGHMPGMANIHGVETDHSFDPPSTNTEDWELLNDGKPIVHYSQTIGKQKIDPVGFYLTKDNLALFYNSGWDEYGRWHALRKERGYAGATNQSGSLMAFNDDWSFEDYPGNPVLDQPQRQWQGRNRVNPYALVWHPVHEKFYCFYGDFAEGGDNDKYPGRRALGVASSIDLVNWNYLTVDKPLFHIKDMQDFHPETFSEIRDVTRQGRVYALGATWHEGYIYLMTGGSTNRELNYTFILRSKDPLEGWEFVQKAVHSPMPFYYSGKWYSVRNMRDPNNRDKRAIGLVSGETLNDLDGEPEYLFSTGFSSSSGVSRQLFMYNGRWYVAFRQADEDNYRSMYLARQK